MFAFVLLASIYAFQNEAGEINMLTMENWDSLIDKRDPDSVWFVMFSGDGCPACKVTEPVFRKAALEADGMINFGLVKADQEAGLQLRFQIKMLPTFFIIHKDGKTEYKGKRSERAMVNAAAKYIPDRTAVVDPEWVSPEQPCLILFTEKPNTPPIWSAVSVAFKGKANVGISRDHDMMEMFGVEKTPTILLVNKTHKIKYVGKNSFMKLRQTAEDFLEGQYEPPIDLHVDYYIPEEYEEECEKWTGYCVMQVSDELSPGMASAKDKFNSDRLKFFYGTEDLPYQWMQKDKVYVFAPRKEMVLKLDTVSELNVALTTVLDGSAEWTPVEDMNA